MRRNVIRLIVVCAAVAVSGCGDASDTGPNVAPVARIEALEVPVRQHVPVLFSAGRSTDDRTPLREMRCRLDFDADSAAAQDTLWLDGTRSVEHIYRTAGRRRVVLQLTDDRGAEGLDTLVIDVEPLPYSPPVLISGTRPIIEVQVAEVFIIFWTYGPGAVEPLRPEYKTERHPDWVPYDLRWQDPAFVYFEPGRHWLELRLRSGVFAAASESFRWDITVNPSSAVGGR